MWKIATFLVAVSVASVQAGIDRTDCRVYAGGYGQTVSCAGGYVPVALCTSGRDADCNGYYTRLTCCRETSLAEEVPEPRACTARSGGYGAQVYCSTGQMALQVCTSGRDADCGGSYTSLQCCDDHSQTISTSSCGWLYGGYGATVDCSANRVITGVCSSGRDADCGTGAYTGIYCCTVL